MSIEADYLDVMPTTITWYQKSGALNNYAARSFSGSATTARGYVQFASEVEGSNGGVEESRDVFPKGTIYLYGNVTISVDDKILLPDGQEVKVLDVSKVYDNTGVHHVKVTF